MLKDGIERCVLKEDDAQTNNKQHADKQTQTLKQTNTHRETSNVIKVKTSPEGNLLSQTFCVRVSIRRPYVLCNVHSMIDDHMLFVTEYRFLHRPNQRRGPVAKFQVSQHFILQRGNENYENETN